MSAPSMGNAQTCRFDYLRHYGNGFFLGLKGLRGGLHAFSLARDDVTRLIEAYIRECGAPARPERAPSRQAAGGRQQIIRLGNEAAVVVPVATYWHLIELAGRVEPGAVELAVPVEAPTVGQWAELNNAAGRAGGASAVPATAELPAPAPACTPES